MNAVNGGNVANFQGIFSETLPNPQTKTITLIFKDTEGKEFTKAFDPVLLKEITFFKTCLESNFKESDTHEIFLPDSSVEEIELLADLFIHKKCLLDILDHENLTDPDFYERLKRQILFFFEGEKFKGEELILQLQEQIRSLPYALAQSLLANFKEKLKFAKEKESKNGNEPEPVPFYIQAAEEVYINRIFFKDNEEYEKTHLEKMRKMQRKISAASVLLAETENKMGIWKNSGLSLKPLKASIRDQKSNLKNFSHKLKKMQSCDQKMKPSMLLKASQFKDSDNFLIQNHPILANARRLYKIYKEHVLNNLQYQKNQNLAQMHRTDLLNYIDLFAYYEFRSLPGTNKSYPFINPLATTKGVSFGYNLKNADPRALEEEMRTDIGDTGGGYKNLPPKFFKEDEVFVSPSEASSLSLDPVISKLREDLIPLFKKKNKSEEEEKAMKEPLIERWGWNQFGITFNDLELDVIPEEAETNNLVRVRGLLTKFDKMLKFFFRIDEFKPIILKSKIEPTLEGTHLFLTQLFNDSQKS